MKFLKIVLCYLFLFSCLFSYSQKDSIFLKKEHDLYVYVNGKGEKVIKARFSKAKNFSEGYAPVVNEHDFTFHYIDTTGKIAFPEEYNNAGEFHEGLAFVKNVGRVFGSMGKVSAYGYINLKGQLVIDFKYVNAWDFKNGFAMVQIENSDHDKYGPCAVVFGLIDKDDNLLSGQWFTSLNRISADSFNVSIRENQYILLRTGELIFVSAKEKKNDVTSISFPASGGDTYSYADPIYVQNDRGNFNFVNGKGRKINDMKYTFAEPFHNGFALVNLDGVFQYIDTSGKVAFPGRYYDAGDFSEGFAYVCEIKGKSLKSNNGKYGFINTKGQLVINYSFDGAANFKKGYAIIAKKNTDKKNFGDREYVFSVIDTTGKQISNKWFSSIQIVGDTAYALIKDKGYYLRLKGEFSDSLIEYLQKNEVLEPDILPQFQGGDNALFKYIHQNVNYPIWAKLMGIQGTVDVNFFVNSLGKVVGVEIEKGVHPLLNKEACRVVKSFPDWIPGMSGEKCVMVRLRVPIYFAPD